MTLFTKNSQQMTIFATNAIWVKIFKLFFDQSGPYLRRAVAPTPANILDICSKTEIEKNRFSSLYFFKLTCNIPSIIRFNSIGVAVSRASHNI